MVGSHTNPSISNVAAPAVYDGARSQTIGLSIRGPELFVVGRFDHWVPVAAEGAGADEGAVQIFFDVTGMAPAQDAEELFSFHASEVERLGPFAYIARGTVRHDELELPMEAVVQTPPAHTPFVVVTFSVDRRKLSEVWDSLTAVTATRRPESGSAQLHPRAWLRAPTLATS